MALPAFCSCWRREPIVWCHVLQYTPACGHRHLSLFSVAGLFCLPELHLFHLSPKTLHVERSTCNKGISGKPKSPGFFGLSSCKRKRRYAILLCSKPFLFLLQPNNEGVRTQAGGVCLVRSPQTACGMGGCLLSRPSCAIFPRARAPPRLITSCFTERADAPRRIRALHPFSY
jgi:hypothetical protein